MAKSIGTDIRSLYQNCIGNYLDAEIQISINRKRTADDKSSKSVYWFDDGVGSSVQNQ